MFMRASEQRGDALRRAAGGQRLEQFFIEHGLTQRALHVHARRFSRHRDRLFERANDQLGVDRGDERARELDAFAPDSGEPRQREGDHVIAGPEVFNPVLTAAVGHDQPDLFNQRGARRFDRHPWQHGP
jgi:hypothetical protein